MVADAQALEKRGTRGAFMDGRSLRDAETFRGSFSGYERDRLFVNARGAGRFVEAAHALGIDFDHDGRAVAPFDMDGDGDLDVALLSMQRFQVLDNRAASGRRSARVRLRATRSHPAALGAVARLRAAGREQLDRVAITRGLGTQVSPELHFGLGAADRIESLEVRWPSGAVERFSDLPAGMRLTVVEGAGRVEAAPLPRWPEDARPPPAPALAGDLSAPGLRGRPIALARPGRPAVVNFWAPWCEACKREAPALSRLHRAVRDRVDVTGVSVEVQDRGGVAAFARRHRLSHPIALADTALVERFFGADPRIELPATFVIDGAGGLVRAFYREVSGEELRVLLDAAGRASVQDLLDLGDALARQDRTGEAIAALRGAAARAPGDPEAWWRLGELQLAAGDAEGAAASMRRLVEVDPEDHRAYGVLSVILAEGGDLGAAETAAERGLALAPGDPKLLRVMASLHEDRGRLKDAHALALRAVRADPDEPAAYLDLFRLQSKLGRAPEARATRAVYEKRFPHEARPDPDR